MFMKYTFPITKDMVAARSNLSISDKNADKICRAVNRKKYPEAKQIITNLAEEKKSLRGKFYTKTAKEILKLLKVLEANANAKNVDTEKMNLFISAHRGPTLYRARRKSRFGTQMKICQIQAVLKGEKIGTGEKVHSTGDKKSSD